MHQPIYNNTYNVSAVTPRPTNRKNNQNAFNINKTTLTNHFKKGKNLIKKYLTNKETANHIFARSNEQ
jgi:hypothetical protein